MQLRLLFEPEKKNNAPMTQLDAFIHFMQLLDLEMIDLILERNAYMSLPKPMFIKRLGKAFELLRSNADDKLFETFTTNYRMGNKFHFSREVEFVGNHSSLRIPFLIVANKGLILNILEYKRNKKNCPNKPCSKVILLSSMKEH
jgi:hypothetical protein